MVKEMVYGLSIMRMVEIFWAGGIEKEIFNNLDSNYYYKIIEGVSISIITYWYNEDVLIEIKK